MDKLDFGLTLALVGMAGTLASLGLLALLLAALRRLFPARPGPTPAGQGGAPPA